MVPRITGKLALLRRACKPLSVPVVPFVTVQLTSTLINPHTGKPCAWTHRMNEDDARDYVERVNRGEYKLLAEVGTRAEIKP